MEDEERRKLQAVVESESGRRDAGNQDDWVEPSANNAGGSDGNRANPGAQNTKGKGASPKVGKLEESDPFVLAAGEDEDEDEDDWARNAWSKAGSSKRNGSAGVGEVEADDSDEDSGQNKVKTKARGRR